MVLPLPEGEEQSELHLQFWSLLLTIAYGNPWLAHKVMQAAAPAPLPYQSVEPEQSESVWSGTSIIGCGCADNV